MNNGLDILLFSQALEKQKIILSADQLTQFVRFHELLVEWNNKINLISRNEKNITERHFINCALIASFIKFTPEDRIIDIGSGAGFPGIVLKILFPQSSFTLVESTRKKTDFLRQVVQLLSLNNIEVLNDRAEKLAAHPNYKSSFDYVSARAVASLKDLIPLSRPFVKRTGKFLFLKGKSYADEITESGLSENQTIVFPLSSLVENQDGVLITVEPYAKFSS